MIKTLLRTFSVFAVSFVAAVAPMSAQAADQGESGIGKVVDVGQNVGGTLQGFSEDLADLLASTKDEKALDILVGALKKAHVGDGWAKQIGNLRKFAGIADKLLTIVNVGSNMKTLYDAFDDRAAFQDAFATDLAAELVGDAVSLWVKSAGTALVVGGTVVAPGVGTLIATGGVWLLSWAAGNATEWVVKKIVGIDDIRNAIEEVGGVIWDALHHPAKDDGGDPEEGPGPFDGQPDSGNGNGNSKGRYQGLKPIKLL